VLVGPWLLGSLPADGKWELIIGGEGLEWQASYLWILHWL